MAEADVKSYGAFKELQDLEDFIPMYVMITTWYKADPYPASMYEGNQVSI